MNSDKIRDLGFEEAFEKDREGCINWLEGLLFEHFDCRAYVSVKKSGDFYRLCIEFVDSYKNTYQEIRDYLNELTKEYQLFQYTLQFQKGATKSPDGSVEEMMDIDKMTEDLFPYYADETYKRLTLLGKLRQVISKRFNCSILLCCDEQMPMPRLFHNEPESPTFFNYSFVVLSFDEELVEKIKEYIDIYTSIKHTCMEFDVYNFLDVKVFSDDDFLSELKEVIEKGFVVRDTWSDFGKEHKEMIDYGIYTTELNVTIETDDSEDSGFTQSSGDFEKDK